MIVKEPPSRQAVRFEEITYSNMLTLNALVELLSEKGVLTKPEILQRVKKLQSETKVRACDERCSAAVSVESIPGSGGRSLLALALACRLWLGA
jgi:hypothetical protein